MQQTPDASPNAPAAPFSVHGGDGVQQHRRQQPSFSRSHTFLGRAMGGATGWFAHRRRRMAVPPPQPPAGPPRSPARHRRGLPAGTILSVRLARTAGETDLLTLPYPVEGVVGRQEGRCVLARLATKAQRP
jgi:hypothetical protein